MLNRAPTILPMSTAGAPMPIIPLISKVPVPTAPAYFAGGAFSYNSEIGQRTTPERAIYELQSALFVNYELRAKILDIREMDEADGRVKKIHTRMARDITYGGIKLKMAMPNDDIQSSWNGFVKRLNLDNPQKIKSDARGLIMEGNLPMQWVVDDQRQVVSCVRMPSETIRAIVFPTGVFKDPAAAYEQFEIWRGEVIALFPLWQLSMGRLDPPNFDDMGDPGRPYMDASRSVWRKLGMTETDLVIRRRERAPLRTAHTLEGATKDELEDYRKRVEDEQKDITTNYYLNVKGTVAAVQGDANLEQIADVVHLLDTFFAGAPAPAGLFGYTSDLNRDILEDLKDDYYQEVASAQESLAWVYRQGFELQLLLDGMDPDSYEFDVCFQERLTETPNQAADRALKVQALGASQTTVHQIAGLNPAQEKERRAQEQSELDPYGPGPGVDVGDETTEGQPAGKPAVTISPGNRTKGESATDISLRNVS